MKKKIIFVLTTAMLFFSQVMLSSCGDEEENEPVQNNSGKNNGSNNNQQTVKEESKYTVSYSSDFGVAPQNFTVKEGDKLTSGDLKPLDTDGYIFLGWYNGSNQVEEGFVVKQDLKLVAKWTKDGVVYANELKDFLAKKTDDSKVYDVTISDLKPDMDVIVKALIDNPKVKINLNLEGCTELTDVKIVNSMTTLIPSGDSTDDPDVSSEQLNGGTQPIPSGDSTDDPDVSSEQLNGGTQPITTEITSWSTTEGGNAGDLFDVSIEQEDFNLVSLTLPNGIINIVLSCNGLTSLNIPNSVKKIYIYMENPPAIRNAHTINPNCEFYVEKEFVNVFKNTEGWKKLSERIKTIDAGGSTDDDPNVSTEQGNATGSGIDSSSDNGRGE